MSFNLISTLVGESPAIKKIYQRLPALAASDQHLLLVGELATGKDSIAQEIHQSSSRCEQDLVVFRVHNEASEIIELQLFGNLKGAVPGAFSEQIGLLSKAHQSTLFIDGIENLPLDLQFKLFEVLLNKHYFQLGGSEPIACDLRLIAGATDQIFMRVANNHFLVNLYECFAEDPLEIPALSDRSEDLASLLQVYFLKLQDEIDRFKTHKIPTLSAEVLQALESYDWPGNLRELECLAETLLELNLDEIRFENLPELYQQDFSKDQMPLGLIQSDIGFLLEREDQNLGCEFYFGSANPCEKVEISAYDFTANISLKEFIEQIEIQIIEAALLKAENNVAKTARMLGLNRTTLIEKMRKYQIKG